MFDCFLKKYTWIWCQHHILENGLEKGFLYGEPIVIES